jgi:sialidase-1
MYRRKAVQWLSALAISSPSVFGQQLQADPGSGAIEILDTRVISWKPPLYHGWPTLARRANGELLVAFSGGREKHVCPFGRVEWMRSKDNGLTWSWPRVLYDGPIDDRDAGVVETNKGTILVTTFTSLAYEPILIRAQDAKTGDPGAFADPKLLQEWQAVHHRISPEQRKAELGCYMLRSTDGGVNWESRHRVPCNSPHGPVNLDDGRLLYAGKALWADNRVGFWESIDDGVSWRELAVLPTRDGDSSEKYHELHAIQAADGRIVCHIRNHNDNNAGETLQSDSLDGGKTWSTPRSIGVWGLPSHLLRMKSGRLVMSYGYRRTPFGNLIRTSDDHGATWSEPIPISRDGKSGDLGYPSTVECDDGTMVTVWYEVLADSPLAQIRQSRWGWK